jgi:hypothetical protein
MIKVPKSDDKNKIPIWEARQVMVSAGDENKINRPGAVCPVADSRMPSFGTVTIRKIATARKDSKFNVEICAIK